jgi:hypothetical protein
MGMARNRRQTSFKYQLLVSGVAVVAILALLMAGSSPAGTGNVQTGSVEASGSAQIGSELGVPASATVQAPAPTATLLSKPANRANASNDFVDAFSGSTGMPLQGMLNYDVPYSGTPVNTIPLSLPASGCGVKITICNGAPTKLVVGADPQARVTRTPNNDPAPGNLPTNGLWRTPGDHAGTVDCGYWWTGSDSGYSMYCPTGWFCADAYAQYDSGNYDSICCPTGKVYHSTDHKCSNCSGAYPSYDTTNHVCYTTPRCQAANASELYLMYSTVENTCLYCPLDHPIYDPTAKNCITNSSVTTTTIGNTCATLNTILPTAFTDVTFLNATDGYVNATMIRVAYNCPSG